MRPERSSEGCEDIWSVTRDSCVAAGANHGVDDETCRHECDGGLGVEGSGYINVLRQHSTDCWSGDGGDAAGTAV